MKKSLFPGLIALAALTMTSCSNDENMLSIPQDNAIEFGTYIGRDAQTRATVMDVTSLASGFGVFAYYTDEKNYKAEPSLCNFMYNQKVHSNDQGSTWEYAPKKYWPNDPGDKLTFFAYAPYDDSDAANNETGYDNIGFNILGEMIGDPVIKFNVNNDVQKQQDLLWSKSNNIDLQKNALPENGITVDSKVNFHFAHALSRIGFTVKAITDEVDGSNANKLDENTTIVLKEVRITGNYGTGNTAPVEGVFYTNGDLNLNQQEANDITAATYTNVTWTNLSQQKQYFTLNNNYFETQTNITSSDIFDLCNAEGFVISGGEDGNSTVANKLNSDNSYIMIIPQDFTTESFYVYVEYDVITQDRNLGNANDTYDNLRSKVTNHISTEVNGINFQSGKAYTLNLQLGMTSVKLTAEVAGWGDSLGTPVDLPINTQTPTNP